MVRRSVLGILVLVLLIGVSSIYYHYSHQATVSHQHYSMQVPVQVTKVTSKPMPMTITALGSLIAYNSVQVSPQIAGKVASIEFQPGQWVKKGQALIQLDNSIQNAEYNSAKANLQYMQAQYNRAKLLSARGAEASSDLDNSKAQYLVDKALAEEKQVQVEKMVLRAPFSGQMSAALVSQGQYVTVGQSLANIVDRQDLRVQYSVPEAKLALLHLGQNVRITSNAYPKKSFMARVVYISPTVDPATRTLTVWAKVNNQQNLLSPGLFVSVHQTLKTDPHALVIPAESIIASLEGPSVYVVKGHTVYRTPISISARMRSTVAVSKGLKQGEQIVITGLQRLKNGSKVKIM